MTETRKGTVEEEAGIKVEETQRRRSRKEGTIEIEDSKIAVLKGGVWNYQ